SLQRPDPLSGSAATVFGQALEITVNLTLQPLGKALPGELDPRLGGGLGEPARGPAGDEPHAGIPGPSEQPPTYVVSVLPGPVAVIDESIDDSFIHNRGIDALGRAEAHQR